jgi:predicted CXXCH cytochrome family protein
MREPDREGFPPGTRRIFILSLLALSTLAAVCLVSTVRQGAKAQSAQTTTAQQSPQQKVIGRDCRQCHQVIVSAFALDAHGKSGKFLSDSRASVCESCHGNSDKHAENSSRTKSAEGTINPLKIPGRELNQTCLTCHSMDRTHFNWNGGKHDRADMSCLSCHSVHHKTMMDRFAANLTDKTGPELAEILNGRLPEKDLLNFTVEDTCLRCHGEIRKALFQRSTHLFRSETWTDGRLTRRNDQAVGLKVTCTSCHDPHGGDGKRMLVAHSTNEVCYACHAEKRGPMLWEHPPVQENCLTCHTTHGSNNEKLLTRRTHQLCQQCHVNLLPRHSTAAGFDIFTFNRSCMNCHTNIHGSNHPSGRALTR